MRNTCALCGNEIAFGRYGLCQNCLKEWTVTGTYREETVTGTFGMPEWLRLFAKEHQSYDRRKREIPFSVAFPSGEYSGVYVEPMYAVIEQKYRKIERRGRPHKVHHGDDTKSRPPNISAEGTE